MKHTRFYFAAALFLFAACKNSDSEQSQTTNTEAPKVCQYSYDAASSKLEWTAYKTTDKIAVKGSFNTLNIKANSNESMEKVFIGATMEIPVIGVNSKSPERDKKIATNFFGAMANTTNLSGELVSLANGKAVLKLKMNDVETQVEGNYIVSDAGLFVLDISLDMKNFKAENAVASLNKVCEKLHAGADGITKLWDNVDVHFETQLKKECK